MKKSGSSKAVTSSKDPSKSDAQNVSFDVSAQIEEIFQVEALQVVKLKFPFCLNFSLIVVRGTIFSGSKPFHN